MITLLQVKRLLRHKFDPPRVLLVRTILLPFGIGVDLILWIFLFHMLRGYSTGLFREERSATVRIGASAWRSDAAAKN